MSAHRPLQPYAAALLTAVVLATFARTFVVQAFRIPSPSMEPGLLVGDHILVNKFIYAGARLGDDPPPGLPMRGVRRGDVVIFAAPSGPLQTYVKRCLALAGDVVELDSSGLRINRRRPIDESGYTSDAGAGKAAGPYTVAEDHLFCLGDHRRLSRDSRDWGPVPESRLRGRAFIIYWSIEARESDFVPPAPSGKPTTWDRMVDTLRGLVRWPLTCRWKRCLKLVR